MRRTVPRAANVEELSFPATDAPCVKPEAALENGAGERCAMQGHARKTANDSGTPARAIRVPFQMLKMPRLMHTYSLAAADAAKVRAFGSGISQVKRSLYLDDSPIH